MMMDAGRLNLAQMAAFVAGTVAVEFDLEDRAARYGFIGRVLKRFEYVGLRRGDKGVVRQFLEKVTGLGRAQVTRLVRQWRERGQLRVELAARPRFSRRYTEEDVALLARVDGAHEGLSGAAVRKILQREYRVYGQEEFSRLAGLSVSHLYNLRRSKRYRRHRVVVEATQGQSRARWAERRRPEPNGVPGYLRVDTVHQGRQDGQNGPYHVNAVDTVTQWEVVLCCRTLSEDELAMAVRMMMEQFPFPIRSFHSDNGGEYVNKEVARLLEEFRVQFTVSRPSRSTDNALVEGKNGAVVRRWMGWGGLGREASGEVAKFFREQLNPYLNFHRPCGFAEIEVDARGRRKRRYRPDQYCTPYEKLISLPDWEQYLKPGVTADGLRRQALALSDTEAALAVQARRNALFVPRPDSTPIENGGLRRGKGAKRPLAPHPPPPGLHNRGKE